MVNDSGELRVPNRLILTPGPSPLDPRVYRALSTPIVGHMDPWFSEVVSDVQTLLRQVFKTANRITLPLSASGSGGIEAAVVNPLEPGDEAIVCVNGVFSERMAVMASRIGAFVHRVECPLGMAVDPDDVRRVGRGRKIRLIGVCHGEASTGVMTSLDDFRRVANELNALLVVDAVATLVGVPLNIDRQGIDLCFSATQKAISGPPGMAPITLSPCMEEVLRARRTPVRSWYFDLTNAMNFWGEERTGQQTPSISIAFALREALRIVLEEGLEASWQRHKQNQLALIAGLEALGLRLFVTSAAERLPTVTSICVPEELEEGRIRLQLREEFGIEIAGGVGSLSGKILRVGLMGFGSQAKHVLLLLAALGKVLRDQGWGLSGGEGIKAALRFCSQTEESTTLVTN